MRVHRHKKSRLGRVRKKGFTIIELLIVLAIAAVILMVIFLALPALRHSQRNYTRKQFVSKILAAEDQFYGDFSRFPSCDSSGLAPPGEKCNATTNAQANAVEFLTNYLPDGFDPSTGTYKDPLIHTTVDTAWPDTDNIFYVFDSARVDHTIKPDPGVIYIMVGHWCNTPAHSDGTNNLIAGDDVSINRFAILTGMDKGYFCLDNISQ